MTRVAEFCNKKITFAYFEININKKSDFPEKQTDRNIVHNNTKK